MPHIVCNIELDVTERDAARVVMAKEGDSGGRGISVRLTAHGQPLAMEPDAAVLLNIRRGDGETAAYAGRLNGKGEAEFCLPAWLLEVTGDALCDVTVQNGRGERLTSATFTVRVEPAVLVDAGVGSGKESDSVAQAWLSEQQMWTLTPTRTEDGYLLAPNCNRHYALDLSDSGYRSGGNWAKFRLELPEPTQTGRENWIVLTCRAPIDSAAGALVLDIRASNAPLFVEGEVPQVVTEYFDLVCLYSPAASRWQVGMVSWAGGDA